MGQDVQVFESIASRNDKAYMQGKYTDYKSLSPAGRRTVTEIKGAPLGLGHFVRADSPTRAVRTASHQYLPSMGPPVRLEGHSPMNQRISTHYMDDRRLPFPDLVQVEHGRHSPMPMIQRELVHGPPAPGHVLVRRPGHHEDMFFSSVQAELAELKQR